MRTFVAIDLNTQIRGNLSELIGRLRGCRSNIKWVRVEMTHITLKFLGDIREERMPELKTAVREVCERHAAFTVSFRGTGAFPPRSSAPRVLWVGIDQSENLSALHRDLEIRLEKMHFPREKRKFNPHLTIGRVKKKENLFPVLEELVKHRDVHFGDLNVQRVIIFKSTLKPSGAEYTKIAESRLK